MIYQNDKQLLKPIRKYGCYMRSLLWITEVENRRVLHPQEINSYYSRFLSLKYIDENCTVKKPDEILNMALESKDFLIHQVGIEEDGKKTFWGWVKTEDFDWVILHHATTGEIGTHFTVADRHYHEFFDPWDGDYETKGIERFILYKKFIKNK